MDEEMIVKLRDAKSVEEILAVGKEYGKEFTEEQAKERPESCPMKIWKLLPAAVLLIRSRNGSAVCSENKK